MARKMKNSGIEWIGEVPNCWDIDKIKYHLKRNEPKNPGNKMILSVYREYGVIPKDSRDDNHNVTSEDTSKYKYVKEGNLVINKMKAWQGSLAVSQYEGIVSPAYFVYEFTDKNLDKRYFHHLIRGCYKDEFRRVSGGIREGQWDLSPEEFSKTLILLPTFEEQQKIADYLDKKCEEIDSLSLEIQSQISVLEDYKKSVITEAVTKGLNPDVEMKDSGIEWIEKLPITWCKARIGYNSWIRARLGWKGLKAEEYVDKGYAFLSAFNIINNQLNWNDLNYINQERYDESPEIKLCIGDIILVKDGAGIGKCARIDALPVGEATTNGSLAVISTYDSLNYKYLYYYLQSSMFQNYILRIMNGMGVPHLSQEHLRKIIIPIPPIREQQEISDYLDYRCIKIDDAINEKREQLEVLEQYKKSLIYEYVTGKKEVI